jgi:hypothetical protein
MEVQAALPALAATGAATLVLVAVEGAF